MRIDSTITPVILNSLNIFFVMVELILITDRQVWAHQNMYKIGI